MVEVKSKLSKLSTLEVVEEAVMVVEEEEAMVVEATAAAVDMEVRAYDFVLLSSLIWGMSPKRKTL